MTDLLAQGSVWLEDQRHKQLTRTVTYQRGADMVELAATVGRTVFEQADQFGGVHRTEARDYLIRAVDLVLGGDPVLPVSGDRIIEQAGVRRVVYEVMAEGGDPPFRYSDADRQTLRVHTKYVATEGG